MKILFTLHHFPPESYAGTEIYAYNLALELISRGHEVSVFYPSHKLNLERYDIIYKEMDNINIYIILNYLKPDNYTEAFDDKNIDEKYGEILDIVKPDIVHINHVIDLTFGIISATKNRGIPLIITLHDFWFICPVVNLLKEDKLCMERNDADCLECVKALGFNSVNTDDIKGRFNTAVSSLEKADAVISPSLFLKNAVLSRTGFKKEILIITNGVSGEKIHSDRNNIKKIVFGYCGGISRKKGLHMLLNAFFKIKKLRKDMSLYIQGNITEKDYKKYLDEKYPEWGKYYHGPYEPDSVYEIMNKKITVLVVPSIWHENYPTVINEAFLNGIPVIGSRLGGIPEMIDEGTTGLLFDPFDEKDLSDKILSLIENPQKIEHMMKKVADKKIKSMREHALEMEELYLKLISLSNPNRQEQ